jgi:REP element-mobilizing transposase RayT
MPHSLSLVIVHLVFSTKDLAPCLKSFLRPHLHEYLATVSREAGCECYRVGGGSDHVHLAVRLSRSVPVAGLVKELKRMSTRWLKTQYPTLPKFSWQLGYGSFSVGPGELPVVIAQIDEQERHHGIYTFPEEYRALLHQHGVAFDEQRLWD